MRLTPKSGLGWVLRVVLARALRRVANWAEPAPRGATAPASEPSAGASQGDPPAHWLERVRNGAPDLLRPASEGGVPEQVASLPRHPAAQRPSEALTRTTPARRPQVVPRSTNSPRRTVQSPSPAAPTPVPSPRIATKEQDAAPGKPSHPDVVETATIDAPQAVPAVDAAPRVNPRPKPSIAESARPRKSPSITPAVDAAPRPKIPTLQLSGKPSAAVHIRPTPPPLHDTRPSRPAAPDIARKVAPPAVWPELPDPVPQPERRRKLAAEAPVGATRPMTTAMATQPPADRRPAVPHAPETARTESAVRTLVAPPVIEVARPAHHLAETPEFDFPPNLWPELPDDPPPSPQEWAGTLERAARVRNLLAEQRGEVPWNG